MASESVFPGPIRAAAGLVVQGAFSALGLSVITGPTLGATDIAGGINVAGARIVVGTGAPTGDPGVVPVVYIRLNPASAATVLYVCHTGSTWTAIS
jgi:hypothetical protein